MDEAGFDFRGPSERRQAKEFVPPPWEQDAFEELERKRLEAQKQQVRPPDPVPPVLESAEKAAGAVALEGVGASAEPAPESPASPRSAGDPQAAPKQGPSEAALIEMMSMLREEESEPPGHYARVVTAVSILLMAFGMMVILWGMAALAKTGTAGVASKTAGAGLALFGSTFFASGVWMMYRNLKQRGVL